jgi:hypothetical protein
VPADYHVPLHVHREADEAYFILEGEMTLEVNGRRFAGGPGATVHVPKGAAHRFHSSEIPMRYLIVYAPGGFEGFIRAVGEPAGALTLPPPPPPTFVPDFAGLNRIMAEQFATDSLE